MVFIFFKRHLNSNLSLRSPVPTSLGRIISFNKHNVDEFFDNLQSLYKKCKFDGNSVWNVDETGRGVTTEQKTKKIIAEKGKKSKYVELHLLVA